MEMLPLKELYKTRKLTKVDKAYVSNDFKTVIVELQADYSGHSKHPQKLYFDYNNFQATQVEEAIIKLALP